MYAAILRDCAIYVSLINILQVLDMEFASIGMCAYDLALFIETLLFQILYQKYKGNQEARVLIETVIHQGIIAYERTVGHEKLHNPSFVRQVCGLIGCEHLWR